MNFFDKIGIRKRKKSETVNKQSASIPYIDITGGSMSANWLSLGGSSELNKAYMNPAVQPAVNIWGSAVSNMKRSIKNLKSGEVYNSETIIKAPEEIQNLYRLLKQPNPFMSEAELLNFRTITQKVNGNSYTYYRPYTGFESLDKLRLKDLTAIYSLWPQFVKPLVPSNPELFPAELSETIKGYAFVSGMYKKEFGSHLVMHANEVNLTMTAGLNDNPYKGMSPLLPQKMPISNIEAALESRNVFYNNHGMLGIISSDKQNAGDKMPMLPAEREQFDKDLEGFGTKYGQSKYYITNESIKYTNMAMSPNDLGLFEEIWNSSIMIGNGLRVPKNLIETYLQGATFDNQNLAWLRFYQDSVIPFAQGMNQAETEKLGLRELGYEIIGSFDHLQVLQKDEKQAAETKAKNVEATIKAFEKGAATIADIAQANGLESDDDRTILDLSPEERAIVLNTKANGTNEGATSTDGEA